MNIGIKKKDFEILKKYANPNLMNEISYVILNENRFLIAVSKSEANDIIESLMIAFTEVGLQKDSEPNSIGLEIEDVIDVFSKLAYSDDED